MKTKITITPLLNLKKQNYQRKKFLKLKKF